MTVANPAGLAILAALGLTACWFDIRERRLPNWLVLATLAAGLSLTGWQAGLAEVTSHLAHGAVALAVGVALYAVRALGAGDAKYYAALAAWFAPGDALKLLMAVSLCGLVLTLGWLFRRKIAGKPAPRKPLSDMDKVPFGVAMAVGAVLALLY